LGSFNNVAKISPSCLQIWAEILKRTPDATLVLKYGDRFGEEIVCDRYRETFVQCGIMPDRLEFRRAADTLEGHLKLIADVDIALDSFPYQGTMTSLECLAMGTPILSLCGDYYARRATSAMMMRLDLHELVASDRDEYVELATQLMANLDSLRELRYTIQDRFDESTLSNPAQWVKELERVMLRLVEGR
jgi:predicted O-linked N-acetylglucosamine transferase (SPINDLY family)